MLYVSALPRRREHACEGGGRHGGIPFCKLREKQGLGWPVGMFMSRGGKHALFKHALSDEFLGAIFKDISSFPVR